MGRISDIATLHHNHISVAVGQGGKVYMWGQCRGQIVCSPMATPLAHIHDALACYATPSVMHQPLILNTEDEVNVVESLRNAFDDMVWLNNIKIHVILLFSVKVLIDFNLYILIN